MKSRLVQAILLIALFIAGVLVFASRHSETEVSNDGYVAPSP